MRGPKWALSGLMVLTLLLAACTPESDEPEDGQPDDDVGVDGPVRLSWVLSSYLSPEYALSAPWACDGGSNLSGYCNEDFDELIAQANASDRDTADALYQQAEDVLLEDMPLIPMWYGLARTVYSERVDQVMMDAGTYLRIERIESEDDGFSVYGCEPQTLIPQDSQDACGGQILDQLFSGLVQADPETAETELVVAESIDVNDALTEYTITLHEDFTFHDGSEVTANSFVDAWNLGANPANGYSGVGAFQHIEGFHDVVGGDADELSGLEVIDDTTFTVTLSQSFSPFIDSLQDPAFFPLPAAAFEDLEAFNEAPIGNGRYQMVGEWNHGAGLEIERFDAWPGDEPAVTSRVEFIFFNDLNTAYLEVLDGGLDVLPQIPPERLTDVEEDFGDRMVSTETSLLNFLAFPMYDEAFADPQLRQALSLAIDRQQIIDVIFGGSQQPATAVIPPVLDAYRDDACEFCEHDPQRAQELFDDAGGYDGELTIYFNSGDGHEEWAEAVANQWRDVLGIEEIDFESMSFAQLLDTLSTGVE